MKKIIIYTTRFRGYCNAAKKLLEQKGVEYQENVYTKETKWKNSEKHIRNLGLHPKSSVTGKISEVLPTWSNATPRIFNESDKT